MNFDQLMAQRLESLLLKPHLGVRVSPLALTAADATLLLERLPQRFPQLRLAVCAPGLSRVSTPRTFGGSGEEVAEQATAWRNQLDVDAGERLVYISARRLGRAGGLQETLLELSEQSLRQSLEAALSPPDSGLNPQLLAGLRAARLFQTADVAPLCRFLVAALADPEGLVEAGRLLPSLQLLTDSRLRESPELRLKTNAEWVRQAVQRETRAAQQLLTPAGRLQATLRQQLLVGERAPEQVLARLDLGQLSTVELTQVRAGTELEVVEPAPLRPETATAAPIVPTKQGPQTLREHEEPLSRASNAHITSRDVSSSFGQRPLSAATTVQELRASQSALASSERGRQGSSRSPTPSLPPRRTAMQSRSVLPTRSEEAEKPLHATPTGGDTPPPAASAPAMSETLTQAAPAAEGTAQTRTSELANTEASPELTPTASESQAGRPAEPVATSQQASIQSSSTKTHAEAASTPTSTPIVVPPGTLNRTLRTLLRGLEGTWRARFRSDRSTLKKLFAADMEGAFSSLPLPASLHSLDGQLFANLRHARNALLEALRRSCGHQEPLTALVLQPGWLLEPTIARQLTGLLQCWHAIWEAVQQAEDTTGQAVWQDLWQLEKVSLESVDEPGWLVSPLHPLWLIAQRLGAEEQAHGDAKTDPSHVWLHELSGKLLRGPSLWPTTSSLNAAFTGSLWGATFGFIWRQAETAGLWFYAPTPTLEEAQLKPLSQALLLVCQLYPMLALGMRIRAEGWTAHAVLRACESLESQEHALQRLFLLTSEPVSVPARLEERDGSSRSSRLQVVLESLDAQQPLPAHVELVDPTSAHPMSASDAHSNRQSWCDLVMLASQVWASDARESDAGPSDVNAASAAWCSQWYELVERTQTLMLRWHQLSHVSADEPSEVSSSAPAFTPFCRLMLGDRGQLQAEDGWHVLLEERLPELSILLTTREHRLPLSYLRKNVSPILGEDERPRSAERLMDKLVGAQGGFFMLSGEHNLSLGSRLLDCILDLEAEEYVSIGLDAELLNGLGLGDGARYLYQRTMLSVGEWQEGVTLRLGFHALDTRSSAETVSWLAQGLDALEQAAQQLRKLLSLETAGASVFRSQLQQRLSRSLSNNSRLRRVMGEQLSLDAPSQLPLQTVCLVSRRSEQVLPEALRRARRPGLILHLDERLLETIMARI